MASNDLADRVLNAGSALVRPFPDGARPGAVNIIDRSWTIAELADLVVVVETGRASVALFTAQVGRLRGRPTMAVPGSVFSPFSSEWQPHRGWAVLVRNARDILTELLAGGRDLTALEPR